MRLSEIYNVIEKNSPNLKLVIPDLSNTNAKIKNANEVVKALRALGDLGIWRSIDNFKNSFENFYYFEGAVYVDSKNVIDAISQKITTISQECQSLQVAISKSIDVDYTGIKLNIKLPYFDSLAEQFKFYDDLKFIMESLSNDICIDDIKPAGCESGSEWYSFFLSLVDFESVKSVFDSITPFFLYYLSNKQRVNKAKEKEASKEIVDYIENEYRGEVEKTIDQYISDHNIPNKANREIPEIKNNLNVMSNKILLHMENGMKFEFSTIDANNIKLEIDAFNENQTQIFIQAEKAGILSAEMQILLKDSEDAKKSE